MIRMEVGKEDTIYSEGVKPGMKHSAHGPVSEIQDDHLYARLYDYAALPSKEARDNRATTDYCDLHLGPPSRTST
jgi:hypothetical protein